MKFLSFLIGCLILTGVTLSPLVFSQELDATVSEDKEIKGRRTWLIATSLPEGIESPVTVLAGGDLIQVRLSKRSVGTAIKVPKDGLVHVVNPVVAEDGTTTYEILATVTVPEGVNQSLGILAPVPDLTPPLKFRSKLIDLDKFPGGSALFANLTGMEIGVILGSERKTIKPGQIEIIHIGEFSGVKNLAVSYHYRLPKEKEWKVISASTVPMRSSLREILIFGYDNDLGQIDYHGMSFPVSE